MTHNELLAKINYQLKGAEFEDLCGDGGHPATHKALRAVVELHKPSEAWGDTHCGFCFDLAWEPSGLEMQNKQFIYPCPTVQAIEKELS